MTSQMLTCPVVSFLVQWSASRSSFFYFSPSYSKCLTTIIKHKSNTTYDTDIPMGFKETLTAFSSEQYCTPRCLEIATLKIYKLSFDCQRLVERTSQLLGGGGCCASQSIHAANEEAIVKKQLARVSDRERVKEQQNQKSDIQMTRDEMIKLLQIADSDISDQKSFVIDRIIPILARFSVIGNRIHHPNLLKLLMKAINLILSAQVQSSNESQDQDESLVWTDADKKTLLDSLDNLTERIGSRDSQECLLLHSFCAVLIKEMLKTSKSSLNMMKTAVELGVPLFGLIRNQDPTILLNLAFKAREYVLEEITKSNMQSMVKFQTDALKKLVQIPSILGTSPSSRVRLLFAYQSTLSDLLKQSSVHWEVEVFAMLSLSEIFKSMVESKEMIDDLPEEALQQLFEDESAGMFSLCRKRFSLSNILINDLFDSFIINHKLVRYAALEILVNALLLLSAQGKSNSYIQPLISIIYERWLLENSSQVRTVFLNKIVLENINEVIAQKKLNASSDSLETSDETKRIIEFAVNESQTTKQLIEGAKKQTNSLISAELIKLYEVLECAKKPHGFLQLISRRQIESWKNSIIARRMKNQALKDDDLLDSMAHYVGQAITPYNFGQGNEGSEESEVEDTSNSIDGLKYLHEEFLSSQNKVIVVIGGGGSGKSMLLKKFETDLIENNKGNTQSLPIFVKMSELPVELTETGNTFDFIKYLSSQPTFKDQSVDVQKLCKDSTTKKLLLIDAFDEFQGSTFNIWKHFKLDSWENIQVIATTRPEIIAKKETFNLIFSNEVSGSDDHKEYDNNNQGTTTSVLSFKIGGFTQVQLLELAKKLGGQQSGEFSVGFENLLSDSNESIQRLLSLPLNAVIYLKTLKQMNSSGLPPNSLLQLTDSAALKELFMSNAFEREARGLPNGSKDEVLRKLYVREFFEHFQRIALEMLKVNALSLKQLPKSAISTQLAKKVSKKEAESLAKFFFLYQDKSITKIVYISDDENDDSEEENPNDSTFSFAHASLMEFFVARAMISEIKEIPSNCLFEEPKERLLSLRINQKYLSDPRVTRSGGVILSLMSKMVQSEVFSPTFHRSIGQLSLGDNHNYLQVILLSKKQHYGFHLDVAASNMFSVLAFLKLSFQGLNLSRVSASKAYLYGYKGSLDLTGTDLSKAMVLGCTADLSRSKTSQAQSSEARCIWQSAQVYTFSACIALANNKSILTCSSVSSNEQAPYMNEFDLKTTNLLRSRQLYCGSVLGLQELKSTIVVAQFTNILIIDTHSFEDIQVIKANEAVITSFDVQEAGQYIATSHNATISFWQGNSSNIVSQVVSSSPHQKKITCVRFNGKNLLACGSEDKSVSIWKVLGVPVLSFRISGFESPVKALAFNKKTMSLTVGTVKFDGFSIYHIDETKVISSKKISISVPFCNFIVWSSDGKLCIFGRPNRFQAHKFNDQEEPSEEIEGETRHQEGFISLSFTRDFKSIITASQNLCTIQNVEGELAFPVVSRIYLHNSEESQEPILFSSYKSSLIASASNGSLVLWGEKLQKESQKSYEILEKTWIDSDRQEDVKSKVSSLCFSASYEILAVAKSQTPLVSLTIYDVKQKQFKELSKITFSEGTFASPILYMEFSTNNSVSSHQLIGLLSSEVCLIYLLSQDKQLSRELHRFTSSPTAFCFTTSTEVVISSVSKKNDKQQIIEVHDFSDLSSIQLVKEIIMPIFTITTSLVACNQRKHLAAILQNKTAKIYDINKDFKLLKTFIVISAATSPQFACFSEDTKYLSISDNSQISIFNVASGFERVQNISATSNSASPSRFLSTTPLSVLSINNKSISVYDISDSYEIVDSLSSHDQSVVTQSYSPNGAYFLTASLDNSVKLWAVSSLGIFELVQTIRLIKIVKETSIFAPLHVQFAGDSKYFAVSAADKTVRIYRITPQGVIPIQTITNASNVNYIEFWGTTSDTLQLFLATAYDGVDLWKPHGLSTNISLWKSASSSFNKTEVKLIRAAPNKSFIAVGCSSGTIHLLLPKDLTTLTSFTIQNGENALINSLAFTQDSQFILIGQFDTCVQVWNVKNCELECLITSPISKEISSIQVSPCGRLLVITQYSELAHIFNIFYEKEKPNFIHNSSFAAHPNSITYEATFSPTEKNFVTRGRDKATRVWDYSCATNAIQTLTFDNIINILVADSNNNNNSVLYAVTFESSGIQIVQKQKINNTHEFQTIQTIETIKPVAMGIVSKELSTDFFLFVVTDKKDLVLYLNQGSTISEKSRVNLPQGKLKGEQLKVYSSKSDINQLLVAIELIPAACVIVSINNSNDQQILKVEKCIQNVNCASINNDLTQIAAFNENKLSISILSTTSFDMIREISVLPDLCNFIMFSNDSKYLCTLSRNPNIQDNSVTIVAYEVKNDYEKKETVSKHLNCTPAISYSINSLDLVEKRKTSLEQERKIPNKGELDVSNMNIQYNYKNTIQLQHSDIYAETKEQTLSFFSSLPPRNTQTL